MKTWMWVCAGTHTAGAGGQKGCSAKAHKLEHCSFTGQLSPWRTTTATRRVFWFSICQPGHREIMLHVASGEGRGNTNHSQSSERSESCAAAAVQASPTSTSYCFGSRDHTISACFLTSASSQLLSSCFNACLQEQLAFWKKSKHKEERLHVPEGNDNTRQVTA